LRKAIEHLLAEPEKAARMGRAGRRRVEEEMNLDHYAVRLTDFLYDTLTEVGVEPLSGKHKERL